MADLKQRFEERLRESLDKKSDNAVITSAAKRDKIIQDLRRIGESGPKDYNDFNCKRRFELLRVADCDRLIRANHDGDNFKFIACFEEVYDIISQAHSTVGHGGEKKTFNEAKKKWANITQEACHLYISFCEACHQKKARKVPKGIVVKPVKSDNMFSRSQVDLINYQTLPDGGFKYIMTYVNHFSKFCVLRPLQSKRAEEVAFHLLDIFLTFGAPCILQSDNGREFVNNVLSELSILWPNLKLVTGRPRHPQSQGAVERLNGVIQDKLSIWMKENKSKKWSVGLKFVQWQINISQHETTNESPFKVTFGMNPSVGLGSTILPSNVNPHTEEELDDLFREVEEAGQTETERNPGRRETEGEAVGQRVTEGGLDGQRELEGDVAGQTETERGVVGLPETGGVAGLRETEGGVVVQRETGGVAGLRETEGGVVGQRETERGVAGLRETEGGVTGLRVTEGGVAGQRETEGGISGLKDTGGGVVGQRDSGEDTDTETGTQTDTDTENTQFIRARKRALKGQISVAKRMKIRGEKHLFCPKVGDNCTIRIPEFDRGPSDPKNLLVVVLGIENNLYEVGCRQGKLSTKFTAADLDAVPEKLIYEKDVAADCILSVRSAVTKATGGQGYLKCNCTSKCQTLRCSCLKKKMKCNSKCHPGKACNN